MEFINGTREIARATGEQQRGAVKAPLSLTVFSKKTAVSDKLIPFPIFSFISLASNTLIQDKYVFRTLSIH